MFNDLHFIDVRKVADLIIEGKLTDAVALKYLVTISILFGAFIQLPVELEKSEGGILTFVLALASFVVKGVVSYRGVIACKSTNDLIDGVSFFRRFIVLSVPVGVSLSIAYIIFVLALAFLLPAFSHLLGVESFIIIFSLVDIGYTAIFFLYLNRAFSLLRVRNV